MTLTPMHDERMVLDSGTTSHMTPEENSLSEKEECLVPIALGDDSVVHATKRGVKTVHWTANGQQTEVSLSNTLSSSSLAMNLLSVPALTEKDFCVLFTKKRAVIFDENDAYRPIAVAPKELDGLYYTKAQGEYASDCETERITMAKLKSHVEGMIEEQCRDSSSSESDTSSSISEASEEEYESTEISEDILSDSESDQTSCDLLETIDLTNTSESNDQNLDGPSQILTSLKTPLEIWHNRLGNTGSARVIKQMIGNGTLPSHQLTTRNCLPCETSKFRRSYRGSLTKALKPGAFHADVVGKIKPTTLEGRKYFCTVIDEHSKCVHAKALKTKGEASTVVETFMAWMERQSQHAVTSLHTDGVRHTPHLQMD
ncbi:Ribonuclease H [Gracilaria domingensis]|nr:Ribonuclease H [Gracilaria domingensis]